MPAEFKLPDLGDGVDSVDVVSVLVKVGDMIARDQPVFEAETDKAVVEVPSSVAGVVEKINIKKGDTVKAGHVVLTVKESSAAPKPSKTAAEKAQPPAPAGSQAKAEPAPAKAEPKAAPGATGGLPASAASKPDTSRERAPVAAAPTVRQFAREIGVDIDHVEDSDGDGRISVEDVKKAARSRGTGGTGVSPVVAAASTIEPLSKLRKTAAAHLTKCWQEIPHVTLHDKADVTELEDFRAQHKRRAESSGGRLTITPLFMKIVAAALKAHPVVNASIDMAKQTVEYKKQYHIAVAVDTPRGLVVPVVRDVDRKSILDLAVELDSLGAKAREGKLTKEEMSGATFTITNLGSIGVGFFTPIINAPEVAILGIGRSVREPVWDEERKEFTGRLMCPLSLSFDHRLVDGADAARFLRFIVDAVNHPMMLVLQ